MYFSYASESPENDNLDYYINCFDKPTVTILEKANKTDGVLSNKVSITGKTLLTF